MSSVCHECDLKPIKGTGKAEWKTIMEKMLAYTWKFMQKLSTTFLCMEKLLDKYTRLSFVTFRQMHLLFESYFNSICHLRLNARQ
jgi:hypothetical protein